MFTTIIITIINIAISIIIIMFIVISSSSIGTNKQLYVSNTQKLFLEGTKGVPRNGDRK